MKYKFLKKSTTIGMIMGLVMQCVPSTMAYAEVTDYDIYDDVQYKIDQAIAMNENNRNYIDEVIEQFYEDVHSNEEEFNEYLEMSVDSIISVENMKNERYQKVLDNYNEKNVNQQTTAMKINSGISTCSIGDAPYMAALGVYKTGINIVRSRGCSHTADYMEHALEFSSNGSPSTYIHHNDDWARELTTNLYLNCQIAPQFEEEVIGQGKAYGEVHGSFAFTSDNSSLDAFAALHNVDYSAIFTRKSDGTYSVLYKLSDIYDFDWSGYDSFEIGFANNYCFMMQSNGWIKPFQIDIFYSA